MNQVRLIGIIILIIGIILKFTFENDGIDFLFGILIGSGTALTIGRFTIKKLNC